MGSVKDAPISQLIESSIEAKENIEPKITSTYINKKPSSIDKPEIPGLLFKTDLERRPSRKKRRSKPLTITDQENASYSISEEKSEKDTVKDTNIEYTTKNNDSKNKLDIQDHFEEIKLTENEKNNIK